VRVIARVLLLLMLLTAGSFAAQKFQVLIYKDPGYQGDWAPDRCEYGQYNADLNRCELVKYEAFAPAQGIDWHSAESACSDLGGHLVAISSQQEDQRVTELQAAVGGNPVWIGLNDLDQESSWEWTTGEPVTYTNWAPGQPDNHCDEDCVQKRRQVHPTQAFQWNDLDCEETSIDAVGYSYPLGYICEYDVPGDPCPEGYTYVREGNRGLCVKELQP